MNIESLKMVPYIIIYANSGLDSMSSCQDVISYDLIGDIFDIFTSIYAENLKQVYLLHANLWERMFLMATLPAMTHV
jgi:hypothetical protein